MGSQENMETQRAGPGPQGCSQVPVPTFLLIPSLVSCGGRALCEPWNSSYMLLNEEPRTPLGPDTYLF